MADSTISGSRLIRRNVSLGPLTTYRAGGDAALFCELETESQLDELLDAGVTRDRPILVLGRGSNLVVADSGFAGLVVKLAGEFTTAHVEGDHVVAGGAMPLPRLARMSVDDGLRGLEFFVGVPGSVGGAVRQNAGCFGVETSECLVEAEIVDLRNGARRRGTSESLELSYRHSNVLPDELVTRATFAATRGDPGEGRRQMREITRWRKDHQPGGTLNAGSVFKNPAGIAAGELIDSLGLKGMSVGDVSVSDKHANFFVAGPGATAEDIKRLVELVRETVMERSGTLLEPEIQFVGFDDED